MRRVACRHEVGMHYTLELGTAAASWTECDGNASTVAFLLHRECLEEDKKKHGSVLGVRLVA